MRKRITRVQQVKVDIQAIGDNIMAVMNFKRESFNERLRPLLSQGIPYDKAKVMVKSEMSVRPIDKLFNI